MITYRYLCSDEGQLVTENRLPYESEPTVCKNDQSLISQLTIIKQDTPEVTPYDQSIGNGKLINGGVMYLGNFTFYVSAIEYILNNQYYSSSGNYVTLAIGSLLYDRIDLINVIEDGTIGKTYGIANLIKPYYDPTVKVEIAEVSISQNASVYNIQEWNLENWTVSVSDNIIQGYLDVSIGKNVFRALNAKNSNYIEFAYKSEFSVANIDVIGFIIKPTSNWPSNSKILISLYNGSTKVSKDVLIYDGVLGLNTVNSIIYKPIPIVAKEFELFSPVITKVRFEVSTSDPISFNVYNFRIQQGIKMNFISSVEKRNSDLLKLIGLGGTSVVGFQDGLKFKSINTGSNKVSIVDDLANNEIDIDVNPENINHSDLSGVGTNTHAQIDNHLNNTSIHFEQTDIDHSNLLNSGVNTHAQIDSHLNNTSIHFDQTDIDHSNLLNSGVNSHTQIDNHIVSTSNPHSVTIDQVSPLVNKGDLLSHNGIDNVKLSVGSNGQILQADSNLSSGLKWVDSTSIGEINTVSNVGTQGSGFFKQKVGQNFEFKNLAINSNKVILVNDTITNTLKFDVNPNNINHSNLLNSGVNSHAQIDTHLANTSNPHNVTINQISPLLNKGDIIVHNGIGNIRLPVGTQGQILKVDSLESTGLKWVDTTQGETNTISNIGTGAGIFKQKMGVDFELKSLLSSSSILGLTENSNSISLNIFESNIQHQNLAGAGANTHAQIDTAITNSIGHIANVNNPHSVTLNQIKPTTTKGDLLVDNGTSIVRLGVGSDNQILQADSNEPSGVKWASISSSLDVDIEDINQNYQYIQRLLPFTTISNDWQTFINYTTASKPEGTYKFNWSYGWNHNNTSDDFSCQILVNNVQYVLHRQEPKDSNGNSDPIGSGTDQRHYTSGFFMVNFLLSQTHNIKVQIKSTDYGKASTIFDFRMETKRVGSFLPIDLPLGL